MKRLFLFLSLFIFPLPAFAAITLDAFDTFYSGSSGTTHTQTGFTVANHENRLLIVHVGSSSTTSVSTTAVTFNGDSLTSLVATSSTSPSHSSFWYRKQPDVATGDVVVTTNATLHVIISTISLYNVDQTTTFRDNDSASGTSETSTSLTLTSVSGDWLIDGLHANGVAANSPGDLVPGAATETEEVSAQTTYRSSSRYSTASGSTIEAAWSWTSSEAWSHTAATVIPYSAATTSSWPVLQQMMKKRGNP